MNNEDPDSADSGRTNRRTALKLLGVVGVSGLAGCLGGDGETDTPQDETATPTDTPTDSTPTDTTPTPTETPAGDPTASFTVSPETVMLDEQATFDASGSSSPGASITGYEWDFGDGTTATGQSASHTYDTMGEYAVTLTVTDDAGKTASTTTTVSLERSEGPTASFTVSPETVMLNGQATFDGSGSSSPGASITSYEWEFGDGTTATGQSASHTYDTMAEYDVTLTVTDDVGETDSTTTTITLERSEGPTASFSVSPETVMLNEQATFDGSGSSSPGASITDYEWAFGDGTTATGQSVGHTYDTMGSYDVTLTVTDDIGETDTTTTTVSLERSEGPTASFTTSSTSVSLGVSAGFDASGSSSPGASITSYEWAFGDGETETGQVVNHQYEETGSYDVTLTVTDDVGATATDTTTVTVEPTEGLTAAFTASSTTVSLGESVSFDASNSSSPDTTITSYDWEFGDGTTATGQSASHTYDTMGSYEVALTITDEFGETDSTTTLITLERSEGPTASVTVSPETVMLNEQATFDGSGSSSPGASITDYEWAFGDGTTATGQSVGHTYDTMGSYDVTLTVTDDIGETDSTTTTITLERSGGPTASFTTSSTSVSTGDTVTFDASGSSSPGASITGYDWEFGDGASATGQSASHTYDTAGSYDVTLTVTDDIGETDTATATIEVEGGLYGDAIDPSTTIEFETQSSQAWTGVAPAQIEGKNPTLTLVSGEEYTVEWTNVNGGFHNFVIETADGSTPVSTDTMSEEGGTQVITFTVTDGMEVYYCNPHRGLGMEGSIEVV